MDPDDELARALAEASDEATLGRIRRGRWAVERTPPEARRGKEPALFATFVLVVVAGLLLPRHWGRGERDSAQEADLRFAVEAVAMQVEDFRARRGRLPRPAELIPPLSDAVVYLPDGDHYTLEGRLGEIQMVLDSRTRLPPQEEEVGEEPAQEIMVDPGADTAGPAGRPPGA